jgi:hypothetical protein
VRTSVIRSSCNLISSLGFANEYTTSYSPFFRTFLSRNKFVSLREYVDPEPIYFEIKDEDIIVRNGKCHAQNSTAYTQKIDMEYQTSVHQNSIDSPKESIEYDEWNYISHFPLLRQWSVLPAI